jgi:predicted enzyme related to lactoylglutathione lyase
MSDVVVRPVRFTDQVDRMQHFLELIGLRPWILSDRGSWIDLAAGGGRVALHDAATSTSGAPAGQTSLAFEAADVSALAARLEGAGLGEVTVYDEAYGRVLTCVDPDGAVLAVDEVPEDLYGHQLRAEPGAPDSLRVMPVRFTDPAGPYGSFLRALGLAPAGEINPYYVNFLADGGAQGQVGLHYVFGDDLPVVPSGRCPAVQLTFESAEPLVELAARLAAAGYEPGISTEDFGALLHVVDPDGQVVQVHEPASASS